MERVVDPKDSERPPEEGQTEVREDNRATNLGVLVGGIALVAGLCITSIRIGQQEAFLERVLIGAVGAAISFAVAIAVALIVGLSIRKRKPATVPDSPDVGGEHSFQPLSEREGANLAAEAQRLATEENERMRLAGETWATEKQVERALLLLKLTGYSTDEMGPEYLNLGATEEDIGDEDFWEAPDTWLEGHTDKGIDRLIARLEGELKGVSSTEKQVSYVLDLLRECELSAETLGSEHEELGVPSAKYGSSVQDWLKEMEILEISPLIDKLRHKSWTLRPASGSQLSYIRSLLEERGFSARTLGRRHQALGVAAEMHGQTVDSWLESMNMAEASGLIDRLQDLPEA